MKGFTIMINPSFYTNIKRLSAAKSLCRKKNTELLRRQDEMYSYALCCTGTFSHNGIVKLVTAKIDYYTVRGMDQISSAVY